ncbi:urea ABC transporter permease subunit UrtC [Vibrio gangliei]|uniref:urea ABC transporter permease subunit UrtC n=1 Tax=Vibrio gangliei TaxID=2077090 RepID=UPI0014746C50
MTSQSIHGTPNPSGFAARRSFMASDKGGKITIIFLLLLAVVVPVLNLVVPEGNPLHLSSFTVTQMGKYLSYALVALAVDLIWGYLGILSLGHGAFFALGGYAMGMYLTREIGDRGVYGNPLLPDFMVSLNWQELPWFWHGFDHFAFTALMIMLVPGVLAFVFGYLAFRSRVSGVYLSIMTQALTYALMLAFSRNEMGFGGSSGLTGFKDVLGFSLEQDTTKVGLLVTTIAAVIIGYLICRLVISSRLGRVAVAIRDAESRTRFTGYDVDSIKLWVFVLSAVLAGIAGALYVTQAGSTSAAQFAPINSIEIVVWVALGGRATLFGAIVGALIINYAKSWFTVEFPDVWLFALGGIFVLSTMYLPKGVMGALSEKWANKSEPSASFENSSQSSSQNNKEAHS